VTTVGADEKTIRDYIRRQETEDRRLDQLRILQIYMLLISIW
jgi:hypothetical protein